MIIYYLAVWLYQNLLPMIFVGSVSYAIGKYGWQGFKEKFHEQ